MMQKLIRTSAVAMLSLCMLTGSAFAQGPRGGSSMGGGILSELNLSPEQKEQLRDFRDQREEVKIVQAKVKLSRLELQKMLKDKDLNESEAKGKAKELSSLISELINLRVGNMLTLRKTLNDEQFGKLRNFMQQKMSKFRGKFSGSDGPGGSGRRGGFFNRDSGSGPKGRGPSGGGRGPGGPPNDGGDDFLGDLGF